MGEAKRRKTLDPNFGTTKKTLDPNFGTTKKTNDTEFYAIFNLETEEFLAMFENCTDSFLKGWVKHPEDACKYSNLYSAINDAQTIIISDAEQFSELLQLDPKFEIVKVIKEKVFKTWYRGEQKTRYRVDTVADVFYNSSILYET